MAVSSVAKNVFFCWLNGIYFLHFANFLLQMLREIENTLMRMCHDRKVPTEEECNEAVDTDILPAYIPLKGGGARVTMSSSIALLSR